MFGECGNSWKRENILGFSMLCSSLCQALSLERLCTWPTWCSPASSSSSNQTIHSKSWWPWWPDSANFFHFPPKFRLRTRKPSRLHCTNASLSVCRGGAHTAILCLVFVFNKNTSDLLYFDIMLLKTPDLCNLRTFVTIFFLSRFTHIFRQFLEAKKQIPPIYPLLECVTEPPFVFWH